MSYGPIYRPAGDPRMKAARARHRDDAPLPPRQALLSLIAMIVIRTVVWTGAALLTLYVGITLFSPWDVPLTLRHLEAMRGCDAARAVGLAPSRLGHPGYWPGNDRNHDGIACENGGN